MVINVFGVLGIYSAAATARWRGARRPAQTVGGGILTHRKVKETNYEIS